MQETTQAKARPSRLSRLLPILVWTLFGTIWLGGTLALDLFLGASIVRQVRALDYPRAEGRVVASRVVERRSNDREATTYALELRYAYAVGGRTFEGHRLGYLDGSSSDSWAQQMAASLPVGAAVSVSYAPGNPANAILQAGVQGEHLTFVLFAIPFNAILFGVAWQVPASLRRRRDDKGGATVIDERGLTRVRPPTFGPLFTFLSVAALTSFLSMFVVVIGFGFHAPRAAPLVALGLTSALSVWAYGSARAKVRSGVYDIVIDDVARTLTAPRGKRSRPVPRPVPWSAVTSVEAIEIPAAERNRGPTHAVTLTWRGAPGSSTARFGTWPDAASAARFRDWFARRIKLGALEY